MSKTKKVALTVFIVFAAVFLLSLISITFPGSYFGSGDIGIVFLLNLFMIFLSAIIIPISATIYNRFAGAISSLALAAILYFSFSRTDRILGFASLLTFALLIFGVIVLVMATTLKKARQK